MHCAATSLIVSKEAAKKNSGLTEADGCRRIAAHYVYCAVGAVAKLLASSSKPRTFPYAGA